LARRLAQSETSFREMNGRSTSRLARREFSALIGLLLSPLLVISLVSDT
jgi:hypothetical protein